MDVLDDIDRKMIDELRADGRCSVPVLAERVGLSRAAAYQRFDRLIERGVITGFTAIVDHRALGLDVSALILVNAEQGQWRQLIEQLRALPGIEWIGVAAGSFDFAVHARAQSLDQLRDVVLHELQSLDQVRTSETIVLLDEVGRRAPAAD